MASLFDIVSKEVVLSDGDDHQLQGELSHQLLKIENSRRNLSHSSRSKHGSTHYPDLNLYRSILTDSDSVSGHSDIESSAGAERHVTPSTWLDNEEQRSSTERQRPVVKGNLTLANIRLYDNLNECFWQNLESHESKRNNSGNCSTMTFRTSETIRYAHRG